MMLSVSLFVASVVDLLGLNPCCSGGNWLFVSMWCVNLLFSIVSSRVGSREIGLYELSCVWSLSGFGIGIILACFQCAGISLVCHILLYSCYVI